MIVYKFVSDYVDMINTSSADIFDQVTDNPGTSVQPSWLAEDVNPLSLLYWDPDKSEECADLQSLVKLFVACTQLVNLLVVELVNRSTVI